MSQGKKNRYPGVQPFSKEQQHLFFGREEDTQRLFSQVTGEKLTVLFGKSGYGKSSLVQAGLFPALEQENLKEKRFYIPVSIRFNAYQDESDNLNDKYLFHRQEVLEKLDLEEENKLPSLPNSLWGDWKKITLPSNAVIVLVFDQFEEFFSYPIEQQHTFKLQLAELLYTSFPQYLEDFEDKLTETQLRHLSQPLEVKALFAIRSDRLSELDSLKDYLPAILHKRVELGPLNGTQAKEAIIGPALFGVKPEERDWLDYHGINFKSPPFKFQERALDLLLQDLQRSNFQMNKGVEAFLLQVLCNEIENRVESGLVKDLDGNSIPDVSLENLPNVSEVFSQYYFRRLQPLDKLQQAVAQKVIENGLIQINELGEGRRLSVDGGALINTYGKLGLTPELLQRLVETYLLRKEPNTIGGFNYELSHDTLLEPVVASRKKREAIEEKQYQDLQLAKERRKRRRATLLAIVGFILSVIAMVAVIIAFNKSSLAQEKTLEAEQSEQRALDEAVTARAAEKRATKALEDLQKAQADKVNSEVDDIMWRAEQMRQRGYQVQYRDLLQQAEQSMIEFKDNPFLKERLNNIQALIEE